MHQNHRSACGCSRCRQVTSGGRRAFLKAGTLAALGLSLAEYLGLRAVGGATRAGAVGPPDLRDGRHQSP